MLVHLPASGSKSPSHDGRQRRIRGVIGAKAHVARHHAAAAGIFLADGSENRLLDQGHVNQGHPKYTSTFKGFSR